MTLDCAGWPLIVNAQPCIIELPQAYHFGFNLGLNCAESTNFALPLWLPFGRAATRCCCAIGGDDVCVIDMRRFELGWTPGACGEASVEESVEGDWRSIGTKGGGRRIGRRLGRRGGGRRGG